MDKHLLIDGNGTMSLTITVLLFFIARFTLTDIAAACTILAALTTAILNITRVVREKNKAKRDKLNNS